MRWLTTKAPLRLSVLALTLPLGATLFGTSVFGSSMEARFDSASPSEIDATLPSDSKPRSLPRAKKLPPYNQTGTTAVPKPHIVKEFINKDCQKTQSCDLKSFKIEVTKTYEGQDQRDRSVDDLYQGDLMVASYETKDIPSLEKYALVQFIKGCNLGLTAQNGKQIPYIYSQRSFYDFTQPFLHTDWVVDSIDADPLYASVPYDPSRYGSIPRSQWKRHAAYRIYKPNPFADESPEQQTPYQFKNPPEPKLYIFDYPSGSYGGPSRRRGEYSYASMVFRTCVFKTQDVPAETQPSWDGNGNALACFEWSNNHRYDSVRDLWVDANTLDPKCESKSWEQETYVSFNTPIGEPALDWKKTSRDYQIPSRSCDALFGTTLSSGDHFAGDICVDLFHRGKDASTFLNPVNNKGRYAPNPFLTYKLVAGGGASIRLSTPRKDGETELISLFSALKSRAIEVMNRRGTPTEADQAVFSRLTSLDLVVVDPGPGCEGGSELNAVYDPVLGKLLVCPAWTNLPKEAMLEMLSVQTARVFDACSIKPIYKMSASLVRDLRSSSPKLVQTCFSKDSDLKAPQIIANVTAELQTVVASGREEFETIQTKVDAGLIKCSLAQLSNRSLPKVYEDFVSKDVWACARRASGDTKPEAPISAPWLNQTVCSDRAKEIVQNTLAADLMSWYLARDPGLVSPGTETQLLFGRTGRACVAQGMTAPTILGSLERLSLYLNKSEIRSAIGCDVTSKPPLCESRIFSEP